MTKKVIVNPNISDSSNKDNETILLISNYIYNILKENNVDATNNALHHVDELLQSTEEDLENDDEGTEEDA